MELLVYCRGYRPWGADADEPARRELGAVVGERVPVFVHGERLCSFVEVRLPMTVLDPSTEIELLVAKALAACGHPGAGRVLRFGTPRGSVALLLEPGFERARDLCRALQPVLPHARALLERARDQQARPQGSPLRSPLRGSAIPEAIVDPASDRAIPLRLGGTRWAPVAAPATTRAGRSRVRPRVQ